MLAVGRFTRTDRRIDLERTVDSLNGQLRMIRRDRHRAKVEPLPVRLWRVVANLKGGQEFMSAVCNQHARPNTKMVSNANPRT
jgi:hypothetical protein